MKWTTAFFLVVLLAVAILAFDCVRVWLSPEYQSEAKQLRTERRRSKTGLR